MALIDVSYLLNDPDFSDSFTLITRTQTINSYGESVLSESSSTVYGVIQAIDGDILKRVPQDAQLGVEIVVYYRGKLNAEKAGGYCDVIVWNNVRYLVKNVIENYINWGSGWSSAVCSRELAYA
jgi:hypothetical protein